MNIPAEILRQFSVLKEGKVCYGELAKNGTPHAAVIVTVHNGMVNFFCFTSQDLTIKRYNEYDPNACIKLTAEESKVIFPDSDKTTYLYCGKSNWGRMSEDEFLDKMSNGTFSLRAEVSVELLAKIKAAIASSKTMTKKMLNEIGLNLQKSN